MQTLWRIPFLLLFYCSTCYHVSTMAQTPGADGCTYTKPLIWTVWTESVHRSQQPFLLKSFKAFYIRQAVPSSESQAAEVPRGLLEWHFIYFFPTPFTSAESVGVLSDDNMCSTTRDSHPLKTPTPTTTTTSSPAPPSKKQLFLFTPLLSYRGVLYTSFFCCLPVVVFFFLTGSQIIVTSLPRAVQAIKGQSSLHHVARLVCKECEGFV